MQRFVYESRQVTESTKSGFSLFPTGFLESLLPMMEQTSDESCVLLCQSLLLKNVGLSKINSLEFHLIEDR